MFGLGSLVKPELAFEIIRGEIERQLKERPTDLEYFETTKDIFKLSEFDTIFIKEKELIDFDVYHNGKKRKFPFLDGKAFTRAVAEKVKDFAPEGLPIDIAIFKFKEGKLSGTVYYTTTEGEKLSKQIEI